MKDSSDLPVSGSVPASASAAASESAKSGKWLNATVIGIVTATFFSDFSHEMCTAVLPLYLMQAGLGPASLGLIEGVADFLVSLSKLGGGVLGHYVARKRPWVASGYLVTAVATAAMGLVRNTWSLLLLRSVAWIGRGYRSPMRDYLLSDAVDRQYYGRAYGLERAGDMLGAVAGPCVAAIFVLAGMSFQSIILITAVPGLIAAMAFWGLVREKVAEPKVVSKEKKEVARFPLRFWFFLGGVTLFGLGDFSRTFLILLAASAFGADAGQSNAVLSLAVVVYLAHNAISAVAAYPAGAWADRVPKIRVLLVGYILGVATNALLAGASGSWLGVVAAVALSGIYIAVEETVEKAAAAELLPRQLRNLGFGVLACANAVGDMVSSLLVGWLLAKGSPQWAFGVAAGFGAAGVVWISFLAMTVGSAQMGAGESEGQPV
ncbi:MAG: MFS transporter [Pirellulaceae bacterium]|nr:MAG: MFS transporter [Pirellulaceae bacterium]